MHRMAPTPTTEHRTAIGQSSFVSVGLMLSLLFGAAVAGQAWERLNTVERRVDKLATDVERLQTGPSSTGR